MTDDLKNYVLYCNELNDIKVLSKEEEKELFKRYYAGDMNARNKLIESNLKLIRKLVGKYKNLNISLGDLTQDLSLYLFTIIDNFDLSKGYKFSTYAQKCLYLRLLDYLDKQIKNPLLTTKDRIELNIVNKFCYNYINENGMAPDIKIICDNTKLSEKRVTYLFNISNCCISLNGLIDDNHYETMEQDDFENADIYKSSNYISSGNDFEEEICSKLRYIRLKKLILSSKRLTDIEKRNISIMYGFYDGEVKTYRQVAEVYNISVSAVEASVKNGIKKIRKIKGINDFE